MGEDTMSDKGSKGRIRRREQKERVRAIWQQTFGDLDPQQDGLRATRMRDLCPCEHVWEAEVPLWDIIFAACEDPSPLVRMEALHVIEDAWAHGVPTRHGMRLIYAAARKDPDEAVRRRARDLIENAIPGQRQRHRLKRLRRAAARRTDEQDDEALD